MAGAQRPSEQIYGGLHPDGGGKLTGLDGSGFSGLPLTGSLAKTFGSATGASVPVMAALGQITAVFVGGGTIVPWGLIPVAAICNVSPLDLARKNLVPYAWALYVPLSQPASFFNLKSRIIVPHTGKEP